jgi:hypothetical protein
MIQANKDRNKSDKGSGRWSTLASVLDSNHGCLDLADENEL